MAKKTLKKLNVKSSKKPALKKVASKNGKPVKAAVKKASVAKKVIAKNKKAVVKKSLAASPTKAQSQKLNWEQILSPLDDRLLVQVQAAATRTAGGLYIPDTAIVAGNLRGLVVAAGPGHKNKKGRVRPMDVKTGDTVVFSEFVGTKMNLMGTDVQLLRESEILGIVEG